MAAYAALLSLAETIHPILLHDQQATVQEKQLIQSLYDHTVFLQSFLEDYPQEASDLEERIRVSASQTEDVIESFLLEKFHSYYSSNSNQNFGVAQNQSSLYFELRKSHDFEKLHLDIQNLTDEKIDPLVKQVMVIKNSLGIKEMKLLDSSTASPSSISVASSGKEVVVGLDDDLMEIKARICGESPKLQVIPISGMGGIGKTTLARSAYIDPLIVERFHTRAWATVSQNYDTQEIFQSLLISVKSSEKESGKDYFERLGEHVYKGLKGRRYLIVIDDVWSTEAWDRIKIVLPDDNNGSRIILTTRLFDVAAYVDSCSPIHEMRFLDEDRSWSLFQEKVSCPPELADVGKMIARSCRGLPLAVVVVAGLLSTMNQTRDSWENVARNVNKIVANANEDQLDKILSLSYANLPHCLRPCFLYMGGFPEDYKILASELIRLWVAEGFLKPSGCGSYEEQAEVYLKDLVKRNLVLVSERKSNGKIKVCVMHDLLRDMCIRKCIEEKFLLHAIEKNAEETPPEKLKDQRRMSFFSSQVVFSSDMYGSVLRTILYFNNYAKLLHSLLGFRMLKVINALKVTCRGFPSSIESLFHLKFLALKLDYIGEYDSDECCDYEYNEDCDIYLPDEIEQLQKLQTLIVEPCVVLSVSVFRMSELRHIISEKIVFPSLPSQGHFGLCNLQTLGCVLNFECSNKFLQILRNVKELNLFYHKRTSEVSWYKYKLYNLVHMHQLESLKLTLSAQCWGDPSLSEADIAFPASLKSLSLRKCDFPWEDMGVIGSLPKLEVLKLKDGACVGSVWKTSEGEFPSLKFLFLKKSDIRKWITESSHFPSLERLRLRWCRKLRGIPEGIGEIPTLELIDVDDRDKYVVESVRRIQEEQESMGNDTLQVRFTRYKLRPGER